MLITIIILVLSAVFFVNGKVRSDIVALCALIALLVFQILTPDEALSGFFQFGSHYDDRIVCCRRGYFPDGTGKND